MTLTSKENNKELQKLNNKLLEILNDRGEIASHLLSPSSKITNRGNTSQFKLVKDCKSKKVNDLLMHNTKPITLYDNLLKLRDAGKLFEIEGDLLKMITN